MVFHSHVFLFVFLPLTFISFWLSKTTQRRYLVLTTASYVFYGFWDWRFCFLLLFTSVLSYSIALRIESCISPRIRVAWMTLAVAIDLSVLGFFKYYNFLAGSLHILAPGVGLPLLHLILPVGISFYTFHTISYVIDVTARRVHATRNLLEYLTYVSLFCQLVAGPIVRFRQIQEDLENIDAEFQDSQAARAIGLFVIGLVKKVIIADQLGAYVNALLEWDGLLSTFGAWSAAFGYTFQIYFDFSGYSDMAVGLGLLFGLRLPQNFNSPYRAVGPRDFWRRWHISLSTWLRDYLYIPLGGNRNGPLRSDANVLLTMLLGGLWHGANWTFVVWGAYHGVLLILERHFHTALDRLPSLVRRGGTFLLVVIGWVVFRAESLPQAFRRLEKMSGFGAGAGPVPVALLRWCLICLLIVMFVPEPQQMRLGAGKRWMVAWAVLFFVAYLFLNENSHTFIYYQF